MQGEDRARLSAHPVTPQRSRHLVALLAAVAVGVYAADQLTKLWAVAALTDQPARQLIGDVLRLYLVRNPGAAFSFGTGSTWLLTILAVVIIAVIVRASRRLGSTPWAVTLGMILGGAVGNLTDRLLRSPGMGRGHVVDFIDYNGWFVGNVADIAIVAAALLIAILALRGIGIDGTRPDAQATASGPPAGRADD